jgi:hypothetical protein
MDTSRVEAPLTAPASLADLLAEFRGCFSAWTFPVFCALACGMLAQTGRRTVCAMLVGARLSRVWSHHRAHRFFSHARWSVEAVGVVAARLVVRLLVGPDEAVTVAVDDTLFRRRGPKVFAASWFHDGSAQGDKKVGYGNNWVIAAIVVRLAFLDRAVALPVGFALVRKGTDDGSRLACARRLVEALAAALPDRRIDVVADSAYAGKLLRGLPLTVTWTTRLRSNAALYELAPPRTGTRGRPRTKGDKLPSLATLAAAALVTVQLVVQRGGAVPHMRDVLRLGARQQQQQRGVWQQRHGGRVGADPATVGEYVGGRVLVRRLGEFGEHPTQRAPLVGEPARLFGGAETDDDVQAAGKPLCVVPQLLGGDAAARRRGQRQNAGTGIERTVVMAHGTVDQVATGRVGRGEQCPSRPQRGQGDGRGGDTRCPLVRGQCDQRHRSLPLSLSVTR